MLNTIYSTKEISAYRKMIRLLMHGGQKNKAVNIFFQTVLKILQKKKLEKTTNSKAPLAFRKHRFFDHKINYNDIQWLGLESSKFIQYSKNNEISGEIQSSQKYLLDKGQVVNILSIMEHAIMNVAPFLEVRKVRASGKTRQIPSMIQKSRQQTLAIRWLIEAAKKRKKKTNSFSDCLAAEFLGALDKQGGARQKRNELHKIAHSNRTYLRYRWW